MRATWLHSRIQSTRAYWVWRGRLSLLRFYLTRWKFGRREAGRKDWDDAGLFWNIASATAKQMLIAIVVAGVVTLLDRCGVLRGECDWSSQAPDDQTFLMSTAGIGGVLIALYYSGLMSAASSVYSHVPNNVRDLLKRERNGNVYIAFLSFATCLALTFAALNAFAFGLIKWAVPVTWLPAAIGIFAFVNLGRHAFNLFDPVVLAQPIFADLLQLVGRATPDSPFWREEPFQNHAREQAKNLTDTVKTLSALCNEEEHLQVAGSKLAIQIIRFLVWYKREKRRIPRTSQWYEPQFVHKSWFGASSSELVVHAHTQTSLTPDTVRNDHWVEDELMPLVFNALDTSMKQRRLDQSMQIIGMLRHVGRGHGDEWDLKPINALLDKLLKMISHCALEDAGKDADGDSRLEFIAMVESALSIAIEAWLAFARNVPDHPRKEAEASLKTVPWSRLSSLYDGSWRTHALDRLEWLRERLLFESAADGRHITPAWFLAEALGSAESTALYDATTVLLHDLASTCDAAFKRFETCKQPWLAAALVRTEREFWWKLGAQLHKIEDALRDWINNQKVDFRWPTVDFDALSKRAEIRAAELNERMGALLLHLIFEHRPDNYPDYAGQFIHELGEYIFAAGLKGDVGPVQKFFQIYLLACYQTTVLAIQAARKKYPNSHQAVVLALEPMVEAMDISGLLIACGELHPSSGISQAVFAAWDKHIGLPEMGVTPETFEVQMQLVGRHHLAMPHAQFRLQREQRLSAELDKLPRKSGEGRRRGPLPWDDETKVDHPSLLIQAMVDRGRLLRNGMGIFSKVYLMPKLTDAEAIKQSQRRARMDGLDKIP